ncbi:MAG: efflux RND transporter periplasmic adaptor subunit [Clostridia bacterium]|nr:efflux RND transporter periplasmic adaptor subunit [Clostridia bacterium]
MIQKRLCCLMLSALAAGMGATAQASSATARTADIVKTVYGSGTVQPESQPGVYALTDGTLSELLVELGDEVAEGQVVAQLQDDELNAEIAELEYTLQTAQESVADVETHTQYVYRQLYDAEGDKRIDVNTGEPLLGKFSNEITIRAPASGRIKAIYIEAGDDALAVYRDKGAVMLLSTDGRMKVELDGLDGALLALGDTVYVAGEGIEAEGTVVSLTRRGTEAVIEVIGDEYPMDTPVAVSTADGTAVGEGVLAINKPLAVSAYGGTIKGIAVKEGQEVSRYDVLARIVWDEIPLYLDNDLALREYAKALAELESARAKLDALTVVAPCSGKVASVEASEGDSVTDGTKIMTLVEDTGMTVALSVDELDILSVQPGQEVSLTVDALEDAQMSGVVEKIAPLGNTGSGVTTYDVYIELTQVDERVLGGMNVSGEIAIESLRDVLILPTDALRKDGEGYYVTMEDGSARRVSVGVITDDYTQIIEGISEGETVQY